MNNTKQSTTATVSVMKYIDVRDKELLYLIIEKDGLKVAINIGQKSFDLIGEIVQGKKQVEQPKAL